MTNHQHEDRILSNIEELNFCYECGRDLDLKKEYVTCLECDRSTCAPCSRCACDSPETDALPLGGQNGPQAVA